MKKLLPLLLIVCACVTEPKVNMNTPEGVFKLADFYQKQERYEEAINQYKALSNKYPYSKLAVESELRVADCYFKKEDFIEAYNSYKTFKELHPKHPQMDYVTYQAAESLREQVPSTVDRDLTNAAQAINYYEEIVNVYPASKNAADAKEKRFKMIQMLADKELYIADFYYKQNRYLSALGRYEQFMQTFPQNSRVPYALLYAAYSADKIQDKDKLSLHVRRLVQDFPQASETRTVKKEFPNVAR